MRSCFRDGSGLFEILQYPDYPGERRRRPPRGSPQIGLRVGAVLNCRQARKHFDCKIRDTSFDYWRNRTASIATWPATASMVSAPYSFFSTPI